MILFEEIFTCEHLLHLPVVKPRAIINDLQYILTHRLLHLLTLLHFILVMTTIFLNQVDGEVKIIKVILVCYNSERLVLLMKFKVIFESINVHLEDFDHDLEWAINLISHLTCLFIRANIVCYLLICSYFIFNYSSN